MTGANNLYISLPFTVDNTLGRGSCSGTCVLDTFTFPAGTTSVVPVTASGTNRMTLRAFGTGIVDAVVTVAAITSGVSDIPFLTITYFTEV